ncbi:MAG: hypothetical protein WH035_03155, partial [Spirochaetota bacterium]
NIYLYIFYRFLMIFLLFLLFYSILRTLSLIFNIRNNLIFCFYYFSIILSLIIFIAGNYKNYLGKFLREIDVKTIYESYMVVKRKKDDVTPYFSSILEENVSNNAYKKLKINLNWKIILIIFIFFILIFVIGSIFSYYQYGKIVYKVVPAELKEVLTMQSIVEKLLDQLDKDSSQYKFLSKLYEEATTTYSKHGFNEKEYLERLNQILQQSVSLGASKSYQGNAENNSSSTFSGDINKNEAKDSNRQGQSKLLAQKYKKEMEKDDKDKSDSKTKVVTAGENIKQNFFEFLKNQFAHPENPQGKGPSGYEAQDVKSNQNPSVDFSTLMQSIYSNSGEFSYSLSNQLSESQKIEIFNYLVKQLNLNSSNVSFDEQLFYKLITLYFEQLKLMENNK